MRYRLTFMTVTSRLPQMLSRPRLRGSADYWCWVFVGPHFCRNMKCTWQLCPQDWASRYADSRVVAQLFPSKSTPLNIYPKRPQNRKLWIQNMGTIAKTPETLLICGNDSRLRTVWGFLQGQIILFSVVRRCTWRITHYSSESDHVPLLVRLKNPHLLFSLLQSVVWLKCPYFSAIRARTLNLMTTKCIDQTSGEHLEFIPPVNSNPISNFDILLARKCQFAIAAHFHDSNSTIKRPPSCRTPLSDLKL